jgi:hypothetical protein
MYRSLSLKLLTEALDKIVDRVADVGRGVDVD